MNEPSPAVCEADLLVRAVMAKRGYSTEDFAQQASDLSLGHSRTLEHYRHAHEISGRAAGRWVSIQELRQAMTHYHALFDDLIGDDQRPLRDRAAARAPLTRPRGTTGPRR
ncbi:hypothetical protein [Nonomuraea solani]|uniref:hypothetical protein n=1 Tax=Nonomuraea solani TaxID=1144553 RepID=UPI0011B05F58|nr:hypothetical protein [Nonomuraea solani]